MYNIPEKYYHNRILSKSNFAPKEESTKNKKIIRDNLKKARLKYQIEGEDIPDYKTDKYNVSAIMILNIELKDIKYAEILNRIYQKLFKVFLIIKFVDDKENIKIGLGYKRLNEVDKNEIVLEDSFVTEEFKEVFLDEKFNNYEKQFNYNNIVNKFDKLSFYTEAMLKVYILDKIRDIRSYDKILNSNIWYSQENMIKVYDISKKKVDVKNKIMKANLTKEKIEYNKELIKLNKVLGEIIDG